MVQALFKKLFSLFFLGTVICVTLTAQSSTVNLVYERVVDLEKRFLLGDINQKVFVLDSAAYLESYAAPLYTDALNFACNYGEILNGDEDMRRLTVAAVSHAPSAIGDVTVQLLEIFNLWNDDIVRQAVLDVYPELSFFGYESAGVFNKYAVQLLESENLSEKYGLILSCLKVLTVIDDPSSFDVFFACYALPDEEETRTIRDCARQALLAARDEHLYWFSNIIETGSSQYQRSALGFILENNEFSDFFRAEMAEKALSNAIFTAEETDEFCSDDIPLQLMAVNELRRLAWTRSSNLIQRLFTVAVEEWKNRLMTDDELIQVVGAVQELSSLRAGILLSNLLKELNGMAESGDFCSEPLVLAVIRSLGALGDKTAFDALLYVSYLPYPETIIEASRESLARLKW